MSRVKRGLVAHRKHKKLLKLNKGYRGTKSKLVRVAREAELHAREYAFAGRKNKKRDFRRLWIVRISEASKAQGISYSRFVDALTKANVKLDRKILADLVLNDPTTFNSIVAEFKS